MLSVFYEPFISHGADYSSPVLERWRTVTKVTVMPSCGEGRTVTKVTVMLSCGDTLLETAWAVTKVTVMPSSGDTLLQTARAVTKVTVMPSSGDTLLETARAVTKVNVDFRAVTKVKSVNVLIFIISIYLIIYSTCVHHFPRHFHNFPCIYDTNSTLLYLTS